MEELTRAQLVVVATAFAVRILVAITAFAVNGGEHFWYMTDSLRYLALATALVDGDGFTAPLGYAFDTAGAGQPEVVWPPGYPLFVALGALAGHAVAVTIVLQLVLGAIVAGLVYQVARRVASSETVALWAGLLYALDPVSAVHTTYVLSETLFTTVFLTHLLFLLRHIDIGDTRAAALAGIAAAMAALIRPIAFYWPLCAMALIGWRHGRAWRQMAVALSVFALTAVGPLVAWKTRNLIETDYSGFSAVQEVNLYLWIGPSIRAEADGGSWREAQNGLLAELDRLTIENAWSRTERYEYMRSAGVQMIMQNLGAALRVFGQGVASTLSGSSLPRSFFSPGCFVVC